MKKTFLTLAALFCSLNLTSTAQANYANALNKASDSRPVIAFCYGANYDKTSEKLYEEFVKKRKIMHAARGGIFVAIPIFQLPNDKEKRESQRALGNKSLPGGIFSYPCLAIIDQNGNLRGVIQDAREMKNAEKAGEILEAMLESYKIQGRALKTAERIRNDRKAEAIAKIDDTLTKLPGDAIKAALESDPDDKRRVRDRLAFDYEPLLVKLATLKEEEAEAYVRGILFATHFNATQRQEIIAALAGHLRRNGASKIRLRALYTEMRCIAPNTMYASYAEEAIRLWATD